MKINYRTQGTCSSNIEIEVENDIITDVHFTGGCNGNLKGISSLVKGMKVDDVITAGWKEFIAATNLLPAPISYARHCVP